MDEVTLEDVTSFLQWIWERTKEDERECNETLKNPFLLLSYADCYVKEGLSKGTSAELVERLYRYWNQYKIQIKDTEKEKVTEQNWQRLQRELKLFQEEIKDAEFSEEKREFLKQIIDKMGRVKSGDDISLHLLWECQYEFHGFLIGMGEASALLFEMLMPYPQIQYYLAL